MKKFSMILVVLVVLAMNLFGEMEIYFAEDINPNTPSGSGPDTPGRIDYPNSQHAHDTFVGRLVYHRSEDFESFVPGESPSVLYFGEDTAVFTGSPYVLGTPDYFSDDTMNGVWPTSGDQCLLQHNALGETFQIEFNTPQSVLGFYGTDFEAADMQITIYHDNGETTVLTIDYTRGFSGSILFYGIIDIAKPFTKAVFSRMNNSGDGFGFDDFIIGRPDSVCQYTIAGDFNLDCRVDLEDFAFFAARWLVDCKHEPVSEYCE